MEFIHDEKILIYVIFKFQNSYYDPWIECCLWLKINLSFKIASVFYYYYYYDNFPHSSVG